MKGINVNLAKKIVFAVKQVCGYDINFINIDGIVIASTNFKRVNTFNQAGLNCIEEKKVITVNNENDYIGAKKGINCPIFINKEPIGAIGVSGNPKEIKNYLFLAIKIVEIFLTESFLKENLSNYTTQINYIMQTYLYNQTEKYKYTIDILNKFNINTKANYFVITILLNKDYNFKNIKLIEEDIINFFKKCNCTLNTYIYPLEFIGFLPEDNLYILKNALKIFSSQYKDILKIGIGSCTNLENIHLSYKNSNVAISYIKDTENFKFYDDFSLEILLNNIPKNLKEKYIENIINTLNDEEINILKIYFENNMKLKNTSDYLFIHTNTLQYKLDKIYKKTGFNPRLFKDATILYILLNFL